MNRKIQQYKVLLDEDEKNILVKENEYSSAVDRIIGIFELSHGTVSASVCSPREAFIRLLLCGATGFVLAHNHPSGDCTPSGDDYSVTRRFQESAELINIKMLDHLIIGDSAFFSFHQYGSI